MKGKTLFKLGTILTASYMLATNLFASGPDILTQEDQEKEQAYRDTSSSPYARGWDNSFISKPGKDGEDGEDGKPGKDAENKTIIIQGKPGKPGKNGKPGKDGKDGKLEVIIKHEYPEGNQDSSALAKQDSLDGNNYDLILNYFNKNVTDKNFALTSVGSNDKYMTFVIKSNVADKDSSVVKAVESLYNTIFSTNTDEFTQYQTDFPLDYINSLEDKLKGLDVTVNEGDEYVIKIDGDEKDLNLIVENLRNEVATVKKTNDSLKTDNDALSKLYESLKGVTITTGYSSAENSIGNKLGVEIPLGNSRVSLTFGKASNVYNEENNNGEVDRQPIVSQTSGNTIGYTSNNQTQTITKAIETYLAGLKFKLNPESKAIFEIEGGVGYRDGYLTETEKNRLDTYINNNFVSSHTTLNESKEDVKPFTYYFGGALEGKNSGVKVGANVYPADKMIEGYLGFTPREWFKEHKK